VGADQTGRPKRKIEVTSAEGKGGARRKRAVLSSPKRLALENSRRKFMLRTEAGSERKRNRGFAEGASRVGKGETASEISTGRAKHWHQREKCRVLVDIIQTKKGA